MNNQIFQGFKFTSYLDDNGLTIDFNNTTSNPIFLDDDSPSHFFDFDRPTFFNDIYFDTHLNPHLEEHLNPHLEEHLNESEMRTLKKTKFSNVMNIKLDNKVCNICLDEFEEEHFITILPCKHIFHSKCIEEWLSKYNQTCPICRKKVI